jgi:DNA-binding response OmpR family regulator
MTRILVIDDEDDIIANIKDLLEIHNFDVVTANNGKIGLDLVLSTNPDLIICDINMPVMSGLDLIKELRNYPEFYTIPFLFLTANSSNDSVRLGMSLGADDYVTKPYKSAELIKAVEMRLSKSKRMKDSFLSKFDDIKKNISGLIPTELQAPLKAIMTYSKLLQGNTNEVNNSDMNNLIGHIHDSGTRLLRLVENYNTYNNLISNLVTEIEVSNPPVCKPSEIIKLTSFDAAEHYQFSQAGINFDITKDVNIKLSEKYFNKIIFELIDNAIKFSAPAKPIKVISISSNGYYILNITNFGRGMSREEISNIDAFVQFQRDEFEQQGLGLGLAIVKKILELCSGKFQIDSIINDYTTIRVYIPTT